MKCPHCERTERQNRAGKTVAGKQRYQCMYCMRKYTPDPKPRGYGNQVRQQALRMYIDGINFRRIARHLGVHHTTVIRWVREAAEKLPKPPVPEEVNQAELDEMFTFIEHKKTGSTS